MELAAQNKAFRTGQEAQDLCSLSFWQVPSLIGNTRVRRKLLDADARELKVLLVDQERQALVVERAVPGERGALLEIVVAPSWHSAELIAAVQVPSLTGSTGPSETARRRREFSRTANMRATWATRA
jgi:hypothetical protein